MHNITGIWVHIISNNGKQHVEFWKSGCDKEAREIRKYVEQTGNELIYKILYNEGDTVIAMLIGVS